MPGVKHLHPRRRAALGLPRLQLPFSDWPEADRMRWDQACENEDLFAMAGRAAAWRPATRAAVIKGYGRWLGWLVAQSMLNPPLAPGLRVTPDLIARYVAHLHDTTSATTAHSYLQAMGMALEAMEPTLSFDWLWLVVHRLDKMKTSVRRKADRIVAVKELYAFGSRLMDEAEEAAYNTPTDPLLATKYRNGLIIALLAMRPIRLANLQSIEIGKQLLIMEQRGYLRFEAAAVKNGQPLEFALPAELLGRLESYLATWRPLLLSQRRLFTEQGGPQGGTALWISRFGGQLKSATIHATISDLTRKEFGGHVNPHLFRDCAATTVALEDPDHVRITVSILGHACLSTSERYYNHALTQKAAELLQKEVMGARRTSQKRS